MNRSFLSAFRHNTDYFLICLSHSIFSETAHIGDGIFHSLGHDAVAAFKLLTIDIHIVSHDSGVHRGRDLTRTGRLGAVADNARHDGKAVDQGVGDGLIIGPQQEGDSASGPASRTDRSSVGGQTADSRLLVDRD